MSPSGNSLMRRLARRVWPGNNPLRRRTDRFEAWAFLTVLLAAAFSLVLAVSAAQVVLRDELATVRAEQTARHQVTATVVTRIDDQQVQPRTVLVRWGPPDRQSFGATNLNRAARAGDTVRVWVDRENRLSSEPTSPAAAKQTAGVAGASVLIGCTLLTAAGVGSARWWVNRKRLAAWAAEWEWVGPQWRRRTG